MKTIVLFSAVILFTAMGVSAQKVSQANSSKDVSEFVLGVSLDDIIYHSYVLKNDTTIPKAVEDKQFGYIIGIFVFIFFLGFFGEALNDLVGIY